MRKRRNLLIISLLFIISLLGTLFNPEQAHGATGNSTGRLSKWYGGYETSTPYITINGIVAWCIDPDLPFPINQAYVEEVFNDIGVYNILYYADLNGYHLNEDDYVDTFVALNWYLGKPTSQAKQNDPTVKFLYNKAKNPDAPIGAFDIKNKIQTANFTPGNNYQETGWYEPDTDETGIKYTLTVPSGITLITSDGQTKSAGTHTLNQNQNFKLRAPVDYAGTVTLKADTNILKKRALIFLPTNSNVQRLASMDRRFDPATVPDITATFYKRTGKGAIYKRDKATNKGLPGATFSVKNLNTGNVGTVTTDGNGYVSWGEALIGHKLEVTETKAPTNYILNGVKQTITVQSGNTNNLTFQNDKKAELQLSKVQIYTDEAEDGLPINIYTKRIQTSPTANQQQVTVAVYEKESGQKVLSIPYKIGELPETINAKIPSTHLNGNQKRNYIVKLEVDSRYAYVTTGYGQIDTDGYTASKQKITVQAKDTEKIDYKGVIMTERSINQTMKVYYETFALPTNKISKQKTGYGFERDFKPTYTNDLNQATAFNMKVTVDSALIDSYLPYAKTNGKSEVKLEKSSMGIFQLPHVNVERKTGALFTDQQVASNDSRIEYEIKDGKRRLYVPIWIDLGDYALSAQNIEPIGVNQISFVIHDSLNLYAYMFGHYNSETIEHDEIVFEPLLHNQPFPNGIPDNWGYTKPDGTKALTDEEKAWFK